MTFDKFDVVTFIGDPAKYPTRKDDRRNLKPGVKYGIAKCEVDPKLWSESKGWYQLTGTYAIIKPAWRLVKVEDLALAESGSKKRDDSERWKAYQDIRYCLKTVVSSYQSIEDTQKPRKGNQDYYHTKTNTKFYQDRADKNFAEALSIFHKLSSANKVHIRKRIKVFEKDLAPVGLDLKLKFLESIQSDIAPAAQPQPSTPAPLGQVPEEEISV